MSKAKSFLEELRKEAAPDHAKLRSLSGRAEFLFVNSRLPNAYALIEDPGSAQVLFFVGDGVEDPHGLLHKGFRLPFVWRKHSDEAPRFQITTLMEQEQRIKKIVRDETDISLEELEPYRLYPHATVKQFWQNVGHELELSFESGDVALAASLYLATHGARIRGNVWMTGHWDNGVRSVGGIKEKIEVIERHIEAHQSAQEHTLYVPAGNHEDALKYVKHQKLKVMPLAVDAKLLKVLEPVLRMLDIEPDERADLATKLAYANRPYVNYIHYFEKSLARPFGEALQKTWLEKLEMEKCETLVTTLTKSSGLLLFLIHALAAREVLFVMTEQTRGNYENVCARLEEVEVRCDVIEPGEGRALIEKIEERLEGKRNVVFDITAGRALDSIPLYECARRTHHPAIYVHHEHNGRRPIYHQDRTDITILNFS